MEYDNTEDVTRQFYLLCNCGLVMHLILVLLYSLQGKKDMYELMRPYVIISNLLTFGWFISLQYYRLRDTGRACSGDLLTEKPSVVYLNDQGQFFIYYIFAHYSVYIVQKIACICITNKHETEYERRKALL